MNKQNYRMSGIEGNGKNNAGERTVSSEAKSSILSRLVREGLAEKVKFKLRSEGGCLRGHACEYLQAEHFGWIASAKGPRLEMLAVWRRAGRPARLDKKEKGGDIRERDGGADHVRPHSHGKTVGCVLRTRVRGFEQKSDGSDHMGLVLCEEKTRGQR